MKQRLESAEKNFEEKLEGSRWTVAGRAREWDTRWTPTPMKPSRKGVMAQLNELLNRRSYIRNLVVNVQKELL